MKNFVIASLAACSFAAAPVSIGITTTAEAKGRGDGPIIYVTSQKLYYDSIVTADPLPPKGPFQKLEEVLNRLQTKYGPGDRHYVGGRWWEDANGDNQMDKDDHYFSCPLLGPGREAP